MKLIYDIWKEIGIFLRYTERITVRIWENQSKMVIRFAQGRFECRKKRIFRNIWRRWNKEILTLNRWRGTVGRWNDSNHQIKDKTSNLRYLERESVNENKWYRVLGYTYIIETDELMVVGSNLVTSIVAVQMSSRGIINHSGDNTGKISIDE